MTNESFKKWKWTKGTKSRMYETMTSQYGRTAEITLASKDMTGNVCVLLDFVFANKKKKKTFNIKVLSLFSIKMIVLTLILLKFGQFSFELTKLGVQAPQNVEFQ